MDRRIAGWGISRRVKGMETEETTVSVAPEPLHKGERRKTMKRVLLGFGALALLVLGGVAFALPPRVTWTPNPLVTESIAPGETATHSVTLKNTGYLPIPATKQLRIVAEGAIAPFVTVTPPQFPPVFERGQSVTFNVTVSVPVDAPIGVSEGELVLNRVIGKRVTEVWRAEGLPVKMDVVWPTFDGGEELGFSIEYPPGWYVESDASGVMFSNSKAPATFSDFAYFAVTREVASNPDSLPIEDWLGTVFSRGFPSPITGTSITVADRDAVRIEWFNVRTEAIVFIDDAPDVIKVSCGIDNPASISACESILENLSISD